MRVVALLVAVLVVAPAMAEPPAPVWIKHSVPLRVEGEGDTGPALVSFVEVHNSTDETQPAWSGILQWLTGDPGVILCSVEVAFDEPLHENWPSEIRLELSRVTPCRSGDLTETMDVEGRILALDPADTWIRSRTHPLDRVLKPTVERNPPKHVLTPSVIESVLGRSAPVMDCFHQAFGDGYLDCTKVWVAMKVHPDGTITDVEPDTTCLSGWPTFDACLCDAISTLRFPPFEGTPRSVRYPYLVRSEFYRHGRSVPEDQLTP